MARLSLKTKTTTNDLVVNIGTSVNDKTGDPLRTAFGKLKDSINQAEANFIELYSAVGADAPANQLVNGDWTVTLGADGVLSAGSITFSGTLKTGSQSQYQFEELVTGEGEDTVYYSKLTLPNIPEIFGGENLSLVTWGTELAIKVRNPNDFFNDYTWSFGNDGNLSVPDRITFSDNTWQSTAFVGTAYDLRNSPTGNLYVTLDDHGTLNTPLLLPKTFTAVVDPSHYFGEGTLVLEGEAWSFGVQFQVSQDGTVQTMIDNPVRSNNPGYVNGLTFTFVEADHGISGYTFSISLSDIQHPTELVWTVNIAVSPPPEYPATVASLGAIKLLAGESTWVFGTGGQLTVPGPIFRDGGLYMNSSGSTTAASVFVSGNSGGVILRTADNAQQTSHDLTLNVNGETSFPGRLNFSGGSTYNDNILTGAVDSDLAFEVKHRTTASAAHTGPNSPDVLLADITTNDDITVVQQGWEFNAGTELAPNWLPVETVSRNENIYYLIAVSGVTFETGVTYTFRNPVPVAQSWTIRSQTGGLIGPGGVIITNETAPVGEGDTYRELAIELPTPNGLNEQRWVFANDGDFTAPGDITASFFMGQTLDITGAGVVSSTYAGDLNTLHVTGYVGNGLTLGVDGGLTSWLFKPNGTLTLPQYHWIESVGSNATISLNGVGSNESIIELGTRVDGETITSTFAMHPAFGIDLTSVRDVNITAGYDEATAKRDAWQTAEQSWVAARDEDAALVAPDIRPWAGMPSYEAYTEIMSYPTPLSILAQAASTAKAAYELWQAEQAAIKVQVTAKDKTWTFGNDGSITLPVGGDILDSTGTSVLGSGTTLPASTSGYLKNNGSGTLTWDAITIPTTLGDLGITAGSNGQFLQTDGAGSYTWQNITGAVVVTAPLHSYGASGDVTGMIAFDLGYFYWCFQDYVDNSTDCWKRVNAFAGSW